MATLSFVVGTKVKSPADIVNLLSCDSIRLFTSFREKLVTTPFIEKFSILSSITPPVNLSISVLLSTTAISSKAAI